MYNVIPILCIYSKYQNTAFSFGNRIMGDLYFLLCPFYIFQFFFNEHVLLCNQKFTLLH